MAAVMLLGTSVEALGDDIDTIRDRVVELYAGPATGQPGALYRKHLAAIDRQARKFMHNPTLFSNLPQTKPEQLGDQVHRHYRAILIMAQAYASPVSSLFGSNELKARIEAELARGLRWIKPDTKRPGNWYPWQISTPQVLGPTLLMLEDQIRSDLFRQSIEAMADLAGEPLLSGANAVWEGRNHLYLGLLQRNVRRLDLARRFVAREISIGHGGSGLLEDYSFQFHGRLLHTCGYGDGYIYSAAEFAFLCEGTPWGISDAKKQLLARYLTEHARWPVVGKHYDLSVRGRVVMWQKLAMPQVRAMLLLAALKGPASDALGQAAAEMMARGLTDFLPGQAARADKLPELKPPPLRGFRHFYATDFAVFRRPQFYASVRMYSDRLIDYEGNWNTNLTGWFLCYGLTYFSRSGDEYWRDGALRSAAFDWDRLPGTTTRPGIRPPHSYNVGKSPYAGGAGGDRRDSGGMCGFILVPAAGDFVARKSYFFFDRGFAALGSGITSTGRHSEHVVTTVTQWAAPEAGRPLVLSGDRRIGSASGDASWPNVRWAWHDGVGYLFFKPVTLHGHRRGKLTTLWLDHGAAPRDAQYAYIVLPSATENETARLATELPLRVLRQDKEVHALEESDGGALGAVFWQAGKAAGISADAPAVFYREKRDSGQMIAVANPLHTTAALNLTVRGQLPRATVVPAEAKVEQQPNGYGLRVATTNGRIYRLGFGLARVRQQPRDNMAPYDGFRAEATSEGNVTTLTIRIPEAAMKESYQLIVRGSKGHLRAVLSDEDIIDRPGPNVIRFRWTRTGAAIKPDDFAACLFTPLHMMRSPFTIVAPKP